MVTPQPSQVTGKRIPRRKPEPVRDRTRLLRLEPLEDRRLLTIAAAIDFSTDDFRFSVGANATIVGRILDDVGNPLPFAAVGVEDSVTLTSRSLGTTNSEGEFFLTMFASQTLAAGPGLYPLTFIADSGRLSETVVVSLSDDAAPGRELELEVPLGPIARALSPLLMAFVPLDASFSIPLPNIETVKNGALEFMAAYQQTFEETVQEFEVDPHTLTMFGVLGISCPLALTGVGAGFCTAAAGSLVYDFSASFVRNGVENIVEAFIDDPDVLIDVDNALQSTQTLIGMWVNVPGQGVGKVVVEAIDDALTYFDFGEMAVDYGRDALGRLKRLTIVGPNPQHTEVRSLILEIPTDDHGDDAGSASLIGTNQSVPGNIASPSDADWFRFSAVQGGSYFLQTQLAGLSTAELVLYGRDAQSILDSSTGAGPAITWIAPATGEYFLAVKGTGSSTGDYGVHIAESAAGEPDLIVSSLTVPSTGQIGSAIGVPTVVHNNTSVASVPTLVRYVLVNGANEYPLGELNLPALGGHQSYVATPSLPLLASVPPGVYVVRATVDPESTLDESNNDNNARTSSSSIAIATGTQPLPDLVANSLDVPATGAIGAVVHVAIEVSNISTGSAGPSLAQIVLLGSPDVILRTVPIPALAAGQTYVDGAVFVNIPGYVSPGSYSFEFRVNPSGAVNESSTTNNTVASSSSILLHAPANGEPDFAPRAITPTGSAATIGGSLTVDVIVDNPSSADSASYPITFLFSTNQHINFADTESVTVVRGGIAGGGTDGWQQIIPVPGSLAPGQYYVAVDADRGADIDEANDFNNIAVSILPITVVQPSGQSELESLGYNVQPNTTLWGQTISIANNLRNDGDGVYGGGTVEFVISDSPGFPIGTSVPLGTRPISSIAPGASSGANTSLPLPPTKPVSFSGTTVYVGMVVDGELLDVEAITVSDPLPQLALDVLGEDFDVAPFALVNWGGRLEFDIRYKNRGIQYAANFHNAIYISQDAVFDVGDYRLLEYSVPGAAAGAILGESKSVNLPHNVPAGFSGTDDVFLLHVSDSRNELDEQQGELNNSGLGTGIDFRAITITDNPPAGGDPIIGQFFVSPQSFIRGVNVDVVADNVVDDSGQVNDVLVYADSNGNGLYDSGDAQLQPFYMSKAGNTFSGELDTSILDTGDITLIAIAVDNLGNLSQPRFFTVTVHGVGAAVPDAYEYNDTPESAAYIGTNSVALDSLSITPDDHDWFQFAVPMSTAFTVRIDFFQEDGPINDPGNLALEVRRINGGVVGFSNNSSPGQTFEQVSSGTTSGLFEVHVRGDAPSIFNDDYALSITIAPTVAGAPTIGSFTVSPSGVIRPDGQVTLAMNNIQTTGGATIDNRAFYSDLNHNHLIDDGEFLGFGNLVQNGQLWHADITTSVSSWGIGTFDVLGTVWDSVGRQSLVAFNTVIVANNSLPKIGSLAAPSEVELGASFELMAIDLIDPDSPAMPSVVFRIDTDGDGAPSAPDVILAGTATVNGTTVSLTVDTSLMSEGVYDFMATPFDGEGVGSSVSVSVEIVPSLLPQITVGSVSHQNSIRVGQPSVVHIDDVVAPFGSAVATVYTDSNSTGEFEPGIDDVVANAVVIASGDFAATIPPASLPGGVHLFFVEVAGPGAASFHTFVIVSVEPNAPPTIAPIANRSVLEGESIVVNLSAFDPNGDPLTWNLDSAPSGVVMNVLTSQLGWATGELNGPGMFSIVVSVTDNNDPALSDSKSIVIEVREANQMPEIAPIEDIEVSWGEVISFAASATDADFPANNLIFRLGEGAPDNASIEQLSGLFSWTPTIADAGNSYSIPVFVEDDGSPFSRAIEWFTVTVGGPSQLVGRHLFYNRSAFDGDNASINISDDVAVAPDKSAYLPGDGLAEFDNVSSYSRGINGIMIDLVGGGTHGAISLSTLANDFVFKVGNNNTPSSWVAASTPSAVSVRANFDGSGTDRLAITWADGAIKNQWLQVQVLPTSRTGLTSTDIFYWGNKIGDTGNPNSMSFSTTAAGDASRIVIGGSGGEINDPRDIDRSGDVNAGDRAAAIGNIGAITRLSIGSDGPFAPENNRGNPSDDVSLASALVVPSRVVDSAQAMTVQVTSGSGRDSATPRRAAHFQHWAEFAETQSSLYAAESSDDLEELLDALVAGLPAN